MNDKYPIPPILQVGDVILSSDILTEYFCCDLDACKGQCCVDGDAGAPLAPGEEAEMESVLDAVWPELSAAAQTVIDRQGVAYTDAEGDRVTSIVDGRDCVYAYHDQAGCCMCAAEKAFREGRTRWCKPISCYLYPIREKRLGNDLTALNYHRWNVCRAAVEKGRALRLPVYKFLRDPLVRRFGEAWYTELEEVAAELLAD